MADASRAIFAERGHGLAQRPLGRMKRFEMAGENQSRVRVLARVRSVPSAWTIPGDVPKRAHQ
jgi:hypothetical protein